MNSFKHKYNKMDITMKHKLLYNMEEYKQKKVKL